MTSISLDFSWFYLIFSWIFLIFLDCFIFPDVSLTLLDPFGSFLAQNWKNSFFLQNLWSPFYNLFIDIWYGYIWRKLFYLFWFIWVHFGPKNEKFQNSLWKLRSPHHKLSNDIWYDYIWRKPIFNHFWSLFGPFWAQKWKLWKNFKNIVFTSP